MKHLAQHMLSESLRRPYLDKAKVAIREQLRHPGLYETERSRLLQRLASLGHPKVYEANPSPVPGAIDPGPLPPKNIFIDVANATYSTLSALPHTRLYLYATQQRLNVHSTDTKDQVILALLEHAQGTTNSAVTSGESEKS